MVHEQCQKDLCESLFPYFKASKISDSEKKLKKLKEGTKFVDFHTLIDKYPSGITYIPNNQVSTIFESFLMVRNNFKKSVPLVNPKLSFENKTPPFTRLVVATKGK